MKLIYLNAKKYPGNTADHHYVRNLAYAFQKRLGENFTFVSLNTEKDALPNISLASVFIPFFLKKTLVFFFWLPWFYMRKVGPHKLPNELVVFFSNDLNLLTLVIFWKTVLSLHIKIVADWHHLTHSWKDRFVSAHVDYSITTSHKLANILQTISPLTPAHTVYGGVDLDNYDGQGDVVGLRRDLELPEQSFLIGYVGLFTTMGMEKGISMMIGALAKLTPNFSMVFVGGNPTEIEFYKKEALALNVSERCIFLPIQPFSNVVKYEKAMDVLVIPYPDKPHFRNYGFPMKIYEYMASGVPVVYTKLDLIEEVVSDCAYGIPPDSSDELAQVLLNIRKDSKTAGKLAKKSLEKVKSLGWDDKARNILGVFDIIPGMLTIPRAALKYILFQRTDFSIYTRLRWSLRIVMNKRIPIYNLAVKLEALFLPRRTRKLFSLDMGREYSLVKKYLPANPSNILDIGCGVAGIDVMFHKHYIALNSDPHFYLLDKSIINSKVYYGIEKEAAYYNSLDIAKRLLMANGVKESHIHTQEVTEAPLFPGMKFDLVISLISWGFHYPISAYLDYTYGALTSGGTLIVDVRKGTEGEALLEKKFGSLKIISEAQKYRRILVSKM
ncbi:MAG: hypothetical protein A3C79_01970 [Candidatus Taylorbacteria bacterium RIFCSPHIGHO2_02_FULL_45_28]|uniref:Glycosyl transferase family 1 domain-containing protein n=1 Tax=Candidatus Taylorbacteria bacterium RIFCSPHIGHO2_12_FULL_45_16 TaxID=1802315 RepID=A0A1G2N2J5_9BACT|nr:MAG: hypothetical protein A2830_02775 [Candidatus Taylorbacteria bacterium RIFCSPHIGHO2_01_FULL_44_110]OHA25217.1 MAG: hypothetical protein A3C79_01970 [Candidatus Taylorbacteria bacterium RIFCSPHIGHO2_02_FULL_45_28]OHA29461.1 MAG: hypothetical protein A3F51_00280 [Candidatus Taylorbacteria bacterium RIFCSPHIGHO2_12_FULL_45_16]OHA33223.1 MAG: hypothetical protein A3A23_02810 [Candidatus Taylorbacteria bacterium RIFCSPLOWO2_01_FULL_45_59]OHA38273.1 MAG: hypothetical protein A3I98_03075 [Candi